MVIKHQHFFREAYVSIRCLLVVACSLIVREVKGMKEGTGFRKLLCPWNPSIGDVLRWPFSSICSFPVMDFKGGLTGYIFMMTPITGSSWQFDSTTATNFLTASPSKKESTCSTGFRLFLGATIMFQSSSVNLKKSYEKLQCNWSLCPLEKRICTPEICPILKYDLEKQTFFL